MIRVLAAHDGKEIAEHVELVHAAGYESATTTQRGRCQSGEDFMRLPRITVARSTSLLHLWLKPKFSNRFLLVHGAFLLLMAPFGFHWLPQGPVLRTMTGVLFGFGVVTFLWLQPAARGAPQVGAAEQLAAA